MDYVLHVYISILGSAGLSILALAITFNLALLPFVRFAQKKEQSLSDRIRVIDDEVKSLGPDLKGEVRFNKTDGIYKKHGYHPIHSMGLGLSFFVMLPVLLSAIFLLNGSGTLEGTSFLVIDDLSKPDHLMGPINLLPFIMLATTMIDANLRFADDKSSRYRFYIVAAILFVLVYGFASGLILYWTGSNLTSLVIGRLSARRAQKE